MVILAKLPLENIRAVVRKVNWKCSKLDFKKLTHACRRKPYVLFFTRDGSMLRAS